MHALVVLLMGLAAVSADAPAPVIQRIVGGSLTTINQYPEMAALLFSSSGVGHQQACGGTILNNRAILTAAHCTIGHTIASWRARVGSNFASRDGTVINTAQIINHPSYIPWTHDNDIAVLRMASTIPIGSNTVQAGRIAGANYNLADSQVVWAAGWGRTSVNGQFSEQLRHVQIWSINQAICRQRYATVGRSITDNMLCSGWLDVGGRDQCTGDSGGPLYHNGVVVGVCSWGLGCADPFYPGVNARVSRFTNWITQNA